MSNGQFDPAYHATQPGPPQAPLRCFSRWLPLVGAGLAVVGLTAGAAGCSRPAATSGDAAKPAYSDQQVADAKKAVCEAYKKGFQSIRVASTKKSDDSTEGLPGTLLNARIAEVAAANYFINSVRENPAAPSELNELVGQLGDIYQDIVLTQLSDGSREEVHPIAGKADAIIPKIDQLCQ